MVNYKNTVGFDVSKKTLDVCVLLGTNMVFTARIQNSIEALEKLQKKLKKKGVDQKQTLFCFENTGVYSQHLMLWSTINKLQIWMENPLQIKKSMGLVRGKSDQTDAYNIALYAFRFKDKVKLWKAPRRELKKLRDLYTVRKKLVEHKKALQVHIKESKAFKSVSDHKAMASYTKKTLAGLLSDIKNIEKEIQKLISNDKELKRLFNIITSVKGIGSMTAILLLIVTNEFKNMNKAKKIACYAGIAPFPHTSGTSVRGKNRVSPFACKPLKALLHMCALVAIRSDTEHKGYYQRKIEAEKKPPMLVLNAVRNQLLARICACVRDNRKYEKNYAKSLVIT